MSPAAVPSLWAPPALGELARWPLPHQNAVNGFVVRALALLARRHVLAITGLEHVQPARDPFILALNHCTMIESLIVPALLVLPPRRPADPLPGRLELSADPRRRPHLSPRRDHHGHAQIGAAARPECAEAALRPSAHRAGARAPASRGRPLGRHFPRRQGQPRSRAAAAGAPRRGAALAGERRARGAGRHSLSRRRAGSAD